jgi:urea transporter
LFEYVIDCLGVAALTAPFVLASWTTIALARRLRLRLPASSKQGDSHVVHPHA